MITGSVPETIANGMFDYAAKRITAAYLATHVKHAFNFN